MTQEQSDDTGTVDRDERGEETSLGFLPRWIPHPLLTLTLIFLWLALVNKFDAGSLVMGTILGVVIPIYTSNFWPERPMIRSPLKGIVFVLIVAWDIFFANLLVAWIILFRPVSELRSRWIAVPLDLETPEAITALAATITLTPGTVTSDLSADGRTLLVHCLDLADPDAEVARIKNRYEKRIRVIFQ